MKRHMLVSLVLLVVMLTGTISIPPSIAISGGRLSGSGATPSVGRCLPGEGPSVSFYMNPPNGGSITIGNDTWSNGWGTCYFAGEYTITAVPNANYLFTSWKTDNWNASMGGLSVASLDSSATTLTVDEGGGALTANFVQVSNETTTSETATTSQTVTTAQTSTTSSESGAVQTDYGIWVYNAAPVLGEVKVWVQNTPITSDITEAIQYAQTALDSWNQEYPAYALNITYTVHVQEQGEAAPPDPHQNLPGAMAFTSSSPYNVFIMSSPGSVCATGEAWMNPPIITMTYSNITSCQGIGYSVTVHELGHQVLKLGDLYNGPGPGKWLQTHPIINGEIMQGTPSYESYSTLDFYGAWKHNQLHQQYGFSQPSGEGDPVYLPNDIPYKWYCSGRQLTPGNNSGLVGCPLPPVLMWAMCSNPREPCDGRPHTTPPASTTTSTVSETTTSTASEPTTTRTEETETSTTTTPTVTNPPSHPGLSRVWTTRDITYRIIDCDATFVPRVKAAVSNWQGWLPEVSFREVASGESMTFECIMSPTLADGNLAEAETVFAGDVFVHADIKLAINAFAVLDDPQGGINIVDHEIGHALGLEDGSGGLMDQQTYSGMIQVVPPSDEQLSSLHAYYSSLPASTTTETTTTENSTSSSSPPSPSPPQSTQARCIIATAAFGSPMNPEVAYMRYVRDNMIGSTPTGSMLRNGWNSFYYLWSPPIAGMISTSPALQALFRVLLLPLIGTVHATGWAFTMLGGGDFAAVMAFTMAAIFSTLIYIVAPALSIFLLWKRRANLNIRIGH